MTTAPPKETRAFVDGRHPPTLMLVTCAGVSRPPLSMIVAAAAKAYLVQRRGAPPVFGKFRCIFLVRALQLSACQPAAWRSFSFAFHTHHQSRLVSPCNQPQRSPAASFLERLPLFLSV